MKTVFTKIILAVCILSMFLTGLSYSAETMDIANARKKYLTAYQNAEKMAQTNQWSQNYDEFISAHKVYFSTAHFLNKILDSEAVCNQTMKFFEKQLIFFTKVNNPDYIQVCKGMISFCTRQLMLLNALNFRKLNKALKIYQNYRYKYRFLNKTVDKAYRMILFDIASTAFANNDFIKAKNFFSRYLSLGNYLHDIHRIIIQIFNERMKLGNITPEYTQKIALIVFRYTKDPDTNTYREITLRDLKRIKSEVGILKPLVEVMSGGKISIEITPFYLDRVEKTYFALNRRELTRPDFTTIKPPLTDAIIKALNASDVIIGYFSVSHAVNGYGDSVFFPAIPDRLILKKKGIVLISYGPPGDWYADSPWFITHEWFHTVERLFHIPISQDRDLSQDIYNMPERFPGLIKKYNHKNFDVWWWAFSKVIPEHIKKWHSSGNNIGWKRFSFSSEYPFNITDELLQRRRIPISRDDNVPETHWRGEYYYNPALNNIPFSIRDEGTGNITYEERINNGDVSPPNDFEGVRWSRTVHVADNQYLVNFTVKKGLLRVILNNKVVYYREWGNLYHAGIVLNQRGLNKLKIEYVGNKSDNNGILVEFIKCRKVKIKNFETGQYLKEENGRIVTGNGNGNQYFWFIEILPVNNQLVRIRNLITNHYLHQERNVNFIQVSAISSSAWSSHWWLIPSGQERYEFKNRWHSGGVLHIPDNVSAVNYAFIQGRKHYRSWILEEN